MVAEQSSGIYNPYPAESNTPPADAEPQAPAQIDRDPKTGRFTKPGLTASLIREARDAGLTDDDLAEMGAAEVRQHVREAKMEAKWERLFRVQQNGRDAATSVADHGPNPPAAEKFFDDADVHPTIVDAVNKLKAHFDAQLAELKGNYEPVVQHVKAQAKAAGDSFARRMEKFYAKHPEIYGTHKLTGDEARDAEFKESPEFFARMQTFAAWKKAGGDVDDLEAGLESAHNARFGARAAQKQDDEVQRWEDGILGRPTQRGLIETPPGDEKAVQGVREKLKLNGRADRPNRGAYLNPSR